MTRTTPADVALIAILALAIGGLWISLWSGSQAAASAHVHVDGQVPMQIDLHTPARHTVIGRLGPSVLEVADGKIRFVSSPCSNKVCLRSGWIGQSHEAAACVPNRISISLSAPGDGPPSVDAETW